jgi:putative two-component system response regulator
MEKDDGRLRAESEGGVNENASSSVWSLSDFDKKAFSEKELREAIFNFIDLKDKYTAQHCLNVAGYAGKIARMAGFSERGALIVKHAGLLHDIGKVLIDKSILLKKGRLTEAEFYQMQSHPEKGMRCLSMFDLREEIVDAAWHHHERYDGKGYPDGLSGTGIMLPTRIITVCDIVDAMRSSRPYSKGKSLDEIIDELERVRGEQTDPGITDLMITYLQGEKEKEDKDENKLIMIV